MTQVSVFQEIILPTISPRNKLQGWQPKPTESRLKLWAWTSVQGGNRHAKIP